MLITRKLIVSNTLWSALTQVFVLGINLLILPYFIHNIGTELYGIWVISNVVLGYFNIFDFGFTQGLQKYAVEARVKKDYRELSEVVISGMGFLSLIGLVLGVIFYFSADLIVEFFAIEANNRQIAEQLLKISALFCMVMWPLKIVDVILNASMKIKELGFINAGNMVLQSIVMLGLVLTTTDLLTIKWITTVIMAVSSTLGLLLACKYVPEITWSPLLFRFSQIKRMYKFSLGMFYMSTLSLLVTQIDPLIIGRMISMEAVTFYSIAIKLRELIQRAVGLMMVSLVPATYNIVATGNKSKLESLVRNGVLYRSLIAVPLAFTAILIAPEFLRFWVGKEYALKVGFWAQIACITPLFTTLGAGNSVARGAGYVRSSNIVYTFQILLNFGLSIWLVGYFGFAGPLLGTVISVILIGDFTMFPIFCRILGIPWEKTFFMALKISVTGLLVFCFLTASFY